MNGVTFILWTERVGGPWQIDRCDRDVYDEAVKTGVLSGAYGHTVEPKMIAFLRVEDNHDFVLGGSRDEPQTWKAGLRPQDIVAA